MPPVEGPLERARVLVVDDHRLFAEVLCLRLSGEPTVERVERASDVAVARALLSSLRPHVVLLDFQLGAERGLTLVPEVISAAAPGEQPPVVLVLSASTRPEDVIEALRLGVSGWVAKDGDVPELLAAIHTARRGRLVVSPAMWDPLVRALLADSSQVPARVDGLTQRQLDVLQCLVAGMTKRETAERLFVSPNTVRTHVQGLMRRYDVHSTAALAAAARRDGVRPVLMT